jgi:hypothetical protein
MKVVISHPFSGALYAFFAAHQSDRLGPPPAPRDPHSYYRTLYGDAFPRYQEMALTLALLFDELVIVPADAFLPGRQYWQSDRRTYNNPELGLRTEWDFDLQRQLDEEVVQDLRDEEICRVLARVPPLARQQILRDSRHEIHLAQKYDCPIVCVGGRRKIIERIIQSRSVAPQTYGAPALSMAEEYLKLMGPIFEPKDVDTLVDLKGDRELREYAAAFSAAMERFGGSGDVRVELMKALREAMASAKFAKSLSGVFEGTSASLAGLAAEGAAKAAEGRQRSQSWYEFAGQVKRVSSLKRLERRIASELSAIER